MCCLHPLLTKEKDEHLASIKSFNDDDL